MQIPKFLILARGMRNNTFSLDYLSRKQLSENIFIILKCVNLIQANDLVQILCAS